MKFTSVLLLALAAESAVASTWFGKAGMSSINSHRSRDFWLTGHTAYNKWHETELERWLSDHNVPYPAPADRKDLENLVKSNWEKKVVTPYVEWETPQLQSYLKAKGLAVQSTAASNKDALINQVKSGWTDTADTTADSYGSVRDWIFDRYDVHFL